MFGQKNMLDAPIECFQNERYLIHDDPLRKDDAKYCLATINRVFKENGITFIIGYGTLLGAMREHDFIAHDNDIDTIVWAKDMQKVIDLAPELKKYGINLKCYVLPWILTYEYKGISCDIEFIHEAIWPWRKWFCLLHENYIRKSFFENTEELEFLGEYYTVPAKPEHMLTYWYGSDWRIPQRKGPRMESYFFFWRYLHRFIQRCIRWFKRHILKNGKK